MDPWWTEQTGAVLGAVLGGGFGVLFGAIGGGIGGPLASKGKGKPFVVGMFATGLAIGVTSLALGVVALLMGQPYHVWFVPTLIGAVLTAVMGPLLPMILRVYRRHEQRLIAAEELRRS